MELPQGRNEGRAISLSALQRLAFDDEVEELRQTTHQKTSRLGGFLRDDFQRNNNMEVAKWSRFAS